MNDDVLVVNCLALEHASSEIQGAILALETELEELERDAAPLIGAWSGSAREAYDERQRRWRSAAADLTAMLRDIKMALDESAADYQATERRNTQMFS
jgi:WXG100 family type VII secretion target